MGSRRGVSEHAPKLSTVVMVLVLAQVKPRGVGGAGGTCTGAAAMARHDAGRLWAAAVRLWAAGCCSAGREGGSLYNTCSMSVI